MARLQRLAWPLVVAGCVTACVTAPSRPVDQAPLAWPEEVDEPARVGFVRTFTRPRDLGIEKGFLQRLGELLSGETDARLVRPMAVVSTGDIVFVADSGAKGVHRFDPKAGRYDLIGGEDRAPLPSPVGLAVGADGEVYVADSVRAAVFVIRPGAKAAVAVDLPTLRQPTGLAFDAATGRLFVSETAEHRIKVFGRDGALLATLGARGTEDGEFNFPTYLWRDQRGRLFVTDSLNYRVQVFDESLRFLRQFGQPGDGGGDFMRQKGVATDSAGNVYVMDALMSALHIFDEAGRLLLSIGNLGQARGEFWLPAGIFIDPSDQIYIADTYNSRVQVLHYLGSRR